MQPCWKLTFMGMVMVLMVVVTKADTNRSITTKVHLKKADEKFDGNEVKICAANGTNFVNFPNERALKESNRKKGITAFKKVALASCSTPTSENKSTNDPMTIQSKILNKPRLRTTRKLVHNRTPIARRFKKVYKILSASSPPTLRIGDKVTSTTIRTKKMYQNKSTTIRPKYITKIAPMTITPYITPFDKLRTLNGSVVSPLDKISTSTIRPTVNEVEPTRVHLKNSNKKIGAFVPNIKSINEVVTPFNQIGTSTMRPIVNKAAMNSCSSIISSVDKDLTADLEVSAPLSAIYLEPTSIHLKDVNTKKETVVVPNIKPVDEIKAVLNKIGTNTIHKVETNFGPLSVSTVNTDSKVSTVYPEKSANIQPLSVQMGAQKSISCPYAFNPVCATHGGVNSTFLNKCLLNAEKDKTGKDWTIVREGTCNVEKIENKSPSDIRTYSTKENYENPPTVLQFADDDIMFAPFIERTEYEDRRIGEHSYPSFGAPPMTNFGTYNTQFFPSYGTPEMTNFKKKNEQFFSSYEIPAISSLRANNEQSHSSHKATAISFEKSKQSFSPFGTPTMVNFAPNSEQSYPSYGASAKSNFAPNNEIFNPSKVAPARSNFRQRTEQSYPAYKDTSMKSFENTQYNNPLLNSQTHFLSRIPSEAPLPISYPISGNDIGKQLIKFPKVKASIEKRHARYSRQRKHLPCSKMFNPVCATFAGVKSTFNNECLVNAENIKTGSAWTVISHGVCAEEYACTSYTNSLKTVFTRSNDESLYPQTIEQKYIPRNYDLSSEQKVFKNYNDNSPSLPEQKTNKPIKWSTKKKFDSSKKYDEPVYGVQFERPKGYTPPLFRTNSYSQLSPEEKIFEDSSQFAPDIRNAHKVYTSVLAKTKRGLPRDEINYTPPEYTRLRDTAQNTPPLPIVLNVRGVPHYASFAPVVTNFEASVQYEPSLSGLNSRNYAPPLQSVSTESPNRYAPLSLSEKLGHHCRPAASKKPISVVDENVPINKVPVCNFGAAQICGSYKNKRRSFGNICELMLRNILSNETWAPNYVGRCMSPEVCTLGIEPICVSRNGVMETIPNLCYYERLKIQDPFSSWQYHFKGKCFLNPSNPAFERLIKPVNPLTIKVPDHENTNLAFSNSKKLLCPIRSSTLLTYPTEYRRCREIKKSSDTEFAKGPSANTKTNSRYPTSSIIEASSSSTKAPLTTPASYPNFSTSARPDDQSPIEHTLTATKATAKLIPYKKPITRLRVSARKPNHDSIYNFNPKSAKMLLKKRKAFSALIFKSSRSFRRKADRLRWRL